MVDEEHLEHARKELKKARIEVENRDDAHMILEYFDIEDDRVAELVAQHSEILASQSYDCDGDHLDKVRDLANNPEEEVFLAFIVGQHTGKKDLIGSQAAALGALL